MTEVRKPGWVSFWPDRWEGGTMMLTREEEYIYFRLCLFMWAHGRAIKPDEVSTACRFHPEAEAIVKCLIKKGKLVFDTSDGTRNDKAIEEHKKAARFSKAQSERRSKSTPGSTGEKPGINRGKTGDQPGGNPGLTYPEPEPITDSSLRSESVLGTQPISSPPQPEGNDRQASAGVGKTRRGTRLPENWILPPDWQAWAERERPGFDAVAEADRFRDYWIALPGQKAVKVDWFATWRNWVRPRKGNGNAKSTSENGFIALAREYADGAGGGMADQARNPLRRPDAG